jgi:PTH1 family peptidyl-tRNA hydrolase
MSGIRLIVGLGNPGREYEDTRHNAGFRWVEELARVERVDWAKEAKFSGLVARVRGPHELMLLKAQTYYNLTGKAVQSLAQFFRIDAAEILVVHDELDLPPGGVKMKQGGGTAGNNGLKSIQQQLARADFWRLRLGIGHPREFAAKFGADAPEVVDYVLHAPSRDEQPLLDESFKKSLAIVPLIAKGEMEKAMMQLHTKPPPPKPAKPPKPAEDSKPVGDGVANSAAKTESGTKEPS